MDKKDLINDFLKDLKSLKATKDILRIYRKWLELKYKK